MIIKNDRVDQAPLDLTQNSGPGEYATRAAALFRCRVRRKLLGFRLLVIEGVFTNEAYFFIIYYLLRASDKEDSAGSK